MATWKDEPAQGGRGEGTSWFSKESRGLTAGSVAIYSYHIQKTTVYLNVADYRRLQRIARARGCAPAMLVREAVAEYAARHATRRRPKSIGAFSSGRADLSERAEELLAGMGRSRR